MRWLLLGFLPKSHCTNSSRQDNKKSPTELMHRVTQKLELPGHPSLDLKANVDKQGFGWLDVAQFLAHLDFV